MGQNRARGSSGGGGTTGVISSGAVGTTVGGGSRSITRVADAVAAMSGKDSVRMLMGVASGTAGDVAVGGSVFKVRNWVDQPAVAGARVALLMQGGWMVGLGLGAAGAAPLAQDTGLLDVTPLRGADWDSGELYLRRVGSTVSLTAYGLASSDNHWFAAALAHPAPDGFNPGAGVAWAVQAPVWDADSAGALTTTWLTPTDDPLVGAAAVFEYIADTNVYGTLNYTTDDPWPGALPGTPVTTALRRPRLGGFDG